MRIRIESGFQRGGWLLRWTGSGWETIQTVASCTYHDDVDDTLEAVIDDGRYAVVSYRIDGMTQIPSAELLGFSEAELANPPPVSGWYYHRSGFNAAEYRRLENFRQWLEATAAHPGLRQCGGTGGILTDAEVFAAAKPYPDGHRIADIPYEWGCQNTAQFAVFSSAGQFVREERGCGDSTPYLTETGDIRYPEDDRQDFECACCELEEKLEQEHGQFLRDSYARRMNPLPGLRRRIGGVWCFSHTYPSMDSVTDTPCGAVEVPAAKGWVTWRK